MNIERLGGDLARVQRRALFAAAAALLAPAKSAFAQDNGSYYPGSVAVGVRDRPRPGYAAPGYPLGGFQLYPTLIVTPGYDDNIFATNKGTISDIVTTIAPSVNLRSNWGRHALSATASATNHSYAEHSDQDTTDYQFGGSGRLDVGTQSSFTASGNYSHVTQPRTAVDSISTGLKPVQYDQSYFTFGGVQTLSRLQLTETFQVYKTAFGGSAISGTSVVDLSYLNNTSAQVGGRINYAFSPALSAFLAVDYNNRSYNGANPVSPLDRSSNGLQIAVGSSFDVTKLVKGQIRIGYLRQQYEAAGFRTVSGPAALIDVQYFPSELTTLTLQLNRAVIDAQDPRAISFLQTKVTVQADHELLPNLIASAKAGYESDQFRGVDREDHRPSASASTTYLFDRHLGLTAQYSFIRQSSIGAARIGRYAVNVLSLALVLQ